MLGVLVCLVLLVWGIIDPNWFATINLYGFEINLWYPFCILGELIIIRLCKSFACDASCTVSKLVGMMAYCYDIDSVYDSYGTWIVLIETMQIWTLAFYPIIRRTRAWKLVR